jgi:two-component sensor histidine kinase
MFQSAAAPENAFGLNFVTSRQLSVAGRQWTIRFRPTAAFSQPSSPVIPVLLGLFGLLLAVAIALLQRYQSRAYDAMAKLQENAETSLLEKDLMLQEMKHRIKNSITRVLAIARQTAASARDIGEFQDSFSARLQAMAASQDMLTRSRWQKADLGELLRIELAQVFGKELPDGMLIGPRVMLSETVTQALGLTFHELATNALKYGDAGNSPDALKVEWRLLDQGGRLSLFWREASNVPVTPPEKPGFGTRLIDMNITRELKGTIRRDYGANSLHIEIEIPLGGKSG